MLRSLGGRLSASRGISGYTSKDGSKAPARTDPHFKEKLRDVTSTRETRPKSVEDFVGPTAEPAAAITVLGDDEARVIGGVDAFHAGRKARVFRPAREATQTAWNNTKLWKVELDNQERWENPNIGWASSADPMSSLGMHMKFARKEDAVRFCERNGWAYEVVEPQERRLKPKAYGENFHWSKKTRIGCK